MKNKKVVYYIVSVVLLFVIVAIMLLSREDVNSGSKQNVIRSKDVNLNFKNEGAYDKVKENIHGTVKWVSSKNGLESEEYSMAYDVDGVSYGITNYSDDVNEIEFIEYDSSTGNYKDIGVVEYVWNDNGDYSGSTLTVKVSVEESKLDDLTESISKYFKDLMKEGTNG